MLILSSVSFYIIKLTKDIVYMEKAFLDKIQVKLNSKSSLEILKYVLSVSKFHENYVENFSKINILPKKIYLTGEKIETSLSTIKLLDTSGKINALYLDRTYIRRLFNQIQGKEKLADIAYDSYKDWIDKDNLKHINGAEKYYYLFEKGYKYTPRNNQALQDKEELRNIRGFTKIYDKIKSNLIFAYKGNLLNINTADAFTLSIILNIPIDQANSIINLRKKQGYISFSDIERITNKSIGHLIDLYSTFPSKVVIVSIESKKGVAKEKLKVVIDFNTSENYPYSVLKYIE